MRVTHYAKLGKQSFQMNTSGGNSYDEFHEDWRRLFPSEILFSNYETLGFPEITLFKLKYNESGTKLKRPYRIAGRRRAHCRTYQSVNFDLSRRVVRFARVAYVVRVIRCTCALTKSRKQLGVIINL